LFIGKGDQQTQNGRKGEKREKSVVTTMGKKTRTAVRNSPREKRGSKDGRNNLNAMKKS